MPRPAPRAPEGVPPDWLIPDWPAPGHVRAACTARAGGASEAPWATLNLGDHVGDDPAAVRANRQRLRAALSALDGGRPVAPVFLRQVHGTAVANLDADLPDGTEADACTASLPGRACAIMVADCLPVLFTDRQGTRVAAAHAGWRGLAGGVLEQVLKRFLPHVVDFSASSAIESVAVDAPRAHGVLAWLGPCIGPTAFEVGEDVRGAFCACDPAAGVHFRAQGEGKYLADLAGLARQRLGALGVTEVHGNDGGDAWCTVRQPSRFFSHRASMGSAGATGGRFVACVWIGGVRGG
ncbi:peptidoglycan editing factor PgeF [Acidovorax sp. NCPPB 2350]|nr:peptidoglycan editing factor PgeF [Acidovorax sp. NCPPB 2350]